MQGNRDAVAEVGVCRPLFEAEGLEIGIAKLVGEKTESRGHSCPAPVADLDRVQHYFEHVSGLGSLDVDRPGKGMNRVEVEVDNIVRGRSRRQLAVGRLLGVNFDDRAGGHPQHRRYQAAEATMSVLGAEKELRFDGGGRGFRQRHLRSAHFGWCATAEKPRQAHRDPEDALLAHSSSYRDSGLYQASPLSSGDHATQRTSARMPVTLGGW